MRAVWYLLMEDVAEPRQMEQQEQCRGDDRNEDQKYPRSGDVHGSGLSGDRGAEAIIPAGCCKTVLGRGASVTDHTIQ